MSPAQPKYQPWKEFFPTKEQLASTAELSYEPVSAKRNFDKPWRMWMKEPDMRDSVLDERGDIVTSGASGSGADDAIWSINHHTRIVTSVGAGSGSDDAIHSIVTSGGAGSGADDAVHAIVTSGNSGSGPGDAVWALNVR